MAGTVWVVSELYYPEETSTGLIVTQIAEGLAADWRVKVLCAQPTYSARGVRAPRREHRRGVEIHRCRSFTMDKDRLLTRVLNLLTLSLSTLVEALWRIRRGDVVIVVTNPPTLPFIVALACRAKRARCALLVHDVYPEAMIRAGLVKADGLVARLVNSATRRLFRSMDRVIVLADDMKALIGRKCPEAAARIVAIPNHAETDVIHPTARAANPLLIELGLEDRFVVQYAGNMGRTHALGDIIELATDLSSSPSVHFLLIGWGAKSRMVASEAEARQLANITVLPHQPRNRLEVTLNACDVALLAFEPGMAGVSVPCRMYNILAAGKPMIALADKDSELSRLIRAHSVGWAVDSGDVLGARGAIDAAAAAPALLAEMGARARAVAESAYTIEHSLAQYRQLVQELAE